MTRLLIDDAIVIPSLPILPSTTSPSTGLRRSSEPPGLGRPPCRLHIPRQKLGNMSWKIGHHREIIGIQRESFVGDKYIYIYVYKSYPTITSSDRGIIVL